jgi:hypothetical protein
MSGGYSNRGPKYQNSQGCQFANTTIVPVGRVFGAVGSIVSADSAWGLA